MGCAFSPLKCRWHGCCYRNFSQTKGESTCISTGIYGYPIEDAAKIAVREVGDYLTQSCREAEVAEEESGRARSPGASGEDLRPRRRWESFSAASRSETIRFMNKSGRT